MRLRMLGSMLAMALWSFAVQPSALAQAPGGSELDVLYNRVEALQQAGKFGDAIPLAEKYAEGQKARKGENSVEYGVALNALAQLLQETNRLAESERLFRRALVTVEKAQGPDHPNVASVLSNLATLLGAANRMAEAEPLFRRALAIDEKNSGPDHPDVARDLNNLAELFREANRLAEAEPLYRRALAIGEKRLGADAPDTGIYLNNYAMLLQDANRLAEAEPLYRRALAIAEKSLGPDHPSVCVRLSNLAFLLLTRDRPAEAEPLLRRAIAIGERSLGPNHSIVAKAINNLALVLQNTNRLAEAEALHRRALAIREKSLGPGHPDMAVGLGNLALLLEARSQLAEAETLARRALAIDEKSQGPDHPSVARDLNNLALVLQTAGRFREAEPLYRRALAINEKNLGPEHPSVAINLNNLAELFRVANRLAEAEPFYRRALAVMEKIYGPEHGEASKYLNNLALLLQTTNRLEEAEPLYRRALAIAEKSLGPDHPDAAIRLGNLGLLLESRNQWEEAERLYRRALAVSEKSMGPRHPMVARDLNNLAKLLHVRGRMAEAEPLYRRALAVNEERLGPDHPALALALSNLAALLKDANRPAEAEPLLRRALAVNEKSFGPGHPDSATILGVLTTLRQDQNDWKGAAAFCLRTKPVMTGSKSSARTASAALSKTPLLRNAAGLRNCARALYRADSGAAANRAESFALAQWALQNSAADALTDMSARFAKGDTKLSQLVREEQDLVNAREAAYRSLDGATGRADAQAAEAARAAIARIGAELAAKQAQLARDFPDYAELASPKPLSLTEAQALLGEGQALVLFLDLWRVGRAEEETLVFAVTRKEARWTSIPIGSRGLEKRVTALRCGLDSSRWRDGPHHEECKALLNTEVSETQLPPFDAAMAYALYRDLFGGVEDLIKDKSLLIAASGALTQLPFAALVTQEPGKESPRFEAYKTAAWLGQRQAIAVLPSAGSLKALSLARTSSAPAPFLGFGNPLLTGESGNEKAAWARQDCSKAAPGRIAGAGGVLGNLASLFRGGAANVERLRQQPPLPETADELCAAALSLGVPRSELDKAVYLGGRATVSRIRALSKGGELARARVVHFATHGLLAGETAAFAEGKAEPALVLTPPAGKEEAEGDYGLLTASEVAQLKMDADWVIMSACNTAAGSSEGAEALSGLARAFFFAGARALLVSHWYVNSEASVSITTGAVNAIKADPKIGRAEALRRSMSALIAKGGDWSHPGMWAPFVLVGAGEQ